MASAAPDFVDILEALAERDVEFVVIGGVAAVLQGAPITTLDLDLAHSRRPDNVERLARALESLDARYREQPARRIAPSVSHLAGAGHHLLMTRAGPVDLLGAVSQGRGYDELLPHTVELRIGPTLSVRVLDLPMLITLKEEMGRDKDRAMLPVLRRTLEERERL